MVLTLCIFTYSPIPVYLCRYHKDVHDNNSTVHTLALCTGHKDDDENNISVYTMALHFCTSHIDFFILF